MRNDLRIDMFDQVKKIKENFGNGRFIDNLIQDILFKHAVATKGVEIDEMLFTITENDILDKFL